MLTALLPLAQLILVLIVSALATYAQNEYILTFIYQVRLHFKDLMIQQGSH